MVRRRFYRHVTIFDEAQPSGFPPCASSVLVSCGIHYLKTLKNYFRQHITSNNVATNKQKTTAEIFFDGNDFLLREYYYWKVLIVLDCTIYA